jgi:hypothetical protein
LEETPMRIEGYDEIPDEDEVIEEFLGDNPRARELRLMRGALEQRLSMVRRELERAADERERRQLQSRIAELQQQIAAIRQEEAITSFVEDSVRGSLHKAAIEDMI